MNSSSRRVFMLRAVAGGAAAFAAVPARAANPILSESDPAAAALGYRADTTKVDAQKFPKHEASQDCGGCQLYDPVPDSTEPYGNCPLFEGRRVAVKGWCSSWA